MKAVPLTFRNHFHTYDSIWADCYVGYKIERHSGDAPTKESAVTWSSARLPAAQLKQLGQLFLSEFEAPLILSNLYLSSTSSGTHVGSWNQVVAGYGYSLEAFLCCIDRKHIGFLFSIENE
jgi:hypothetical protein